MKLKLADKSRSSLSATIAGKRFALALRKIEEGQFTDAESLLVTTIRSPDLPVEEIYDANLALVLCYKGQEKYKEAEEAILRLQRSAQPSEIQAAELDNWLNEIHIEDIKAKITTALELKTQKKYDQALASLKLLLNSKDISKVHLAHVNHCIAEICLEKPNPEEGLSYALKACEARHDRQDHLYYDSCRLLGRLYRSLGNHAEAAIYYEEIPSGYHSGGNASLEHFKTIDTNAAVDVLIQFSHGKYLLARRMISKQNCLIYFSGTNVDQGVDWKVVGTHEKDVEGLCLSPNGQWIVSASRTEVKIWNVIRSPPILETTLSKANTLRYPGLAISPDSRFLVVNYWGKSTHQWDFVTKKRSILGRLSGSRLLRFSPDGKILAVVIRNRFHLFTYPALDFIVEVEDTHYVSFSVNMLASASYNDGFIKIRDFETRRVWSYLNFIYGDIMDLAFSPDGNLIACSLRESLMLWDIATNKLLQDIASERTIGRNELTFSRDGNYLASIRDGSIKFWNIKYW